LSDNGPAIQGGADWSNDHFYVGAWASSLSEDMEIDVYAGYTPTLGPVTLDLGVIAYSYPGAEDDGAEFDYVEFLVGAEHEINDQFAVGAAFYFSGENYGDTGEATYWEVNGRYAPMEQLEFTAAYGNQSIEDADGPGTDVTDEDDYNTWNIGAAYAIHGFTLDLRYHDTDIDEGSDIEYYTYGESSYDAAVVFTISREL
jgi:uncharacterized protein (TIGR02001 family)